MGDFYSEVTPCKFPAIKFLDPENRLFVANYPVFKARIHKITKAIAGSQTRPQIATDILKSSL